MDLKSLDLHIENLIPGVLLAAEVVFLLNWHPAFDTPNTLISGAVFIATSYSLGVISALTSRAILDVLSESGPRAWVFSLLAHRNPATVENMLRTEDPNYELDVTHEQTRPFRTASVVRWNAIYRGVLRNVMNSSNEKAKSDIGRRREQCRLLRNLFFPLTLAAITVGKSPLASTGLVVLAVLFLTTLYAYAELNIFAEASDIFFSATSRHPVRSGASDRNVV